MAGKQIDFALLKRAAGAYCAGAGKEYSEDGQRVLILPDIQVTLVDGKPACENEAILSEIREILLGLIESDAVECPNLPTKSNGKGNTGMAPRKSNGGPLARSGAVLTVADVLNYLCPGASEKEAMIAVNVCKARGMDPWGGDVHLIKYGNSPLTIVAGKEHFTKKAEANPQFDGFQAGIIVKGKDGYQELEGTFYTDEELVGGWAKVWRKDRKEPFVQKVRLSAFNTGKAQWAKMPEIMVRKCALVNALREAFPGDLGGVYDSSEMGQAIDVDFEEAA